jgi:UDP-N-acetylmuramoyl-L-alanyl-D-glutamate--2,6-diaminopimelate ligase
MRLSQLAAGYQVVPSGADPDVLSITEDSRRVDAGTMFVAVPGTSLDGHVYIPDAVARGAIAVVVERDGLVPGHIARIQVSSSRKALADLAARFHDRPADTLNVIGFTGTFGKTSTSDVLRALLDAGGGRTGVLGSLGARYRRFREPPGGLTTPAPVELHRALRGLRDAGAASVILEVTSHALRLERVHGMMFAGGLLAAIMPGEHTDFHRSYEDYVGAKRLFLAYLKPEAILAYDADNRAARQLAADARVATRAGFSLEGRDAYLQFYDVLLDGRGATFSVAGEGAAGSGERLHSTLLGRGHLRNVTLALAYAFAAGIPVSAAREVLASLHPLRRRMERYEADGRIVLDDTAAHPDSFRATFDVAAMLRHEDLVVVYALRGSRGADINRLNARALADLVAIHGVSSFIATASSDCTGEKDRATAEEVDATRQAFTERGVRFIWHDSLRAAINEAIDATGAGDVIVLIGAQGMDEAQGLLSARST